METSGANGQVAKFLPPLITDTDTLRAGLDIFEVALEVALEDFPELSIDLLEATP